MAGVGGAGGGGGTHAFVAGRDGTGEEGQLVVEVANPERSQPPHPLPVVPLPAPPPPPCLRPRACKHQPTSSQLSTFFTILFDYILLLFPTGYS